MRTVLLWLAAAFVFASFYVLVAKKEALLSNGQTVYLALAPVDPRSLMQGDYMELNYAVMNELNMDRVHSSGSPGSAVPDSGVLVIELDAQNIGKFVRYADPFVNRALRGALTRGRPGSEPLGPREHLLKFHHKGWRAVIGAENFFIQEGSGHSFEQAAFGELKLEPDGTPLIVALCDKDLHRLVASPVITAK